MPNNAVVFPVRDIFGTLMGTDGVGDEVAVAGDTGVSVQPPVGETWIISTATAYGDNTNAGYVSLYDGSLRADYVLNPQFGLGQGDTNTACFRDGKIFIDNTNYLYFFNHNAATRPICYCGEKWPAISNRGIKADVIALNLTSEITITPPAGEVWCVTTVIARPNVTINVCAALDDGGAGERGWLLAPNRGMGEGDNDHACFRDGKVMISTDIRLHLRNYQASPQRVGYSGVQWK